MYLLLLTTSSVKSLCQRDVFGDGGKQVLHHQLGAVRFSDAVEGTHPELPWRWSTCWLQAPTYSCRQWGDHSKP